jgi:hypothetical protein
VNATAALTGFVVVAVSVNLARIMSHPLLPPRAGEALIALVGALVLTSLLLIPRQPLAVQAAECGIVGLLALAGPFSFQLRAYRSDSPNDLARPLTRAFAEQPRRRAGAGDRGAAHAGFGRRPLLGRGGRDPVADRRRHRRLGAAGGDPALIGRGRNLGHTPFFTAPIDGDAGKKGVCPQFR